MARPKRGSKAERDALRRLMADQRRTVDEIAAEMRARFGFGVRAAYRHALGLTLEAAASRLNEQSGDERAPITGSRVCEWEQWPAASGKRPGAYQLTMLATVYGTEPGHLVTVEELVQLGQADQLLLAEHRLPPLDCHVEQERSVGLMTQPARTILVGGERATPGDNVGEWRTAQAMPLAEERLLEQEVGMAAEESAEFAMRAEASNVGPVTLEQLHADTRQIAHEYLTGSPTELFRDARSLRDRVFRILDGNQTPAQAADLYAAAGQLCALLSWMSGDLGRLDAADTQGRTAWLCAELSGQHELRAWVLATRSKTAFWQGRYRDAITYAQRGQEYASDTTAAVLLACQEADAWSELGASAEAKMAIRHAAEARDRVASADAVGGLLSCGVARQANYSAGVYLRLNQADDAIRHAETALAVYETGSEPRSYGTESQLHISRATAHVVNDDIDGAEIALMPVFALPADQRLDTITRRMRHIHRGLATPRLTGSQSVSGFQQQIEDFCTSATVTKALSA